VEREDWKVKLVVGEAVDVVMMESHLGDED
jgi:hypothetical protein